MENFQNSFACLHKTSHAWVCIKIFFIRAILIVYVGGEFGLSFELAKFNIPITYDLGETIKIAQIMLQVKQELTIL